MCLLFLAEVVRRWKHACDPCIILEYADLLGIDVPHKDFQMLHHLRHRVSNV